MSVDFSEIAAELLYDIDRLADRENRKAFIEQRLRFYFEKVQDRKEETGNSETTIPVHKVNHWGLP